MYFLLGASPLAKHLDPDGDFPPRRLSSLRGQRSQGQDQGRSYGRGTHSCPSGASVWLGRGCDWMEDERESEKERARESEREIGRASCRERV